MNTRSTVSKELLKRRGGIDPAALAAASLASAVSTIVQPGPYTPVTLIVGLTILFVVMAYDIEAYRSTFQSMAYSAVLSMTSILASGYPLELYFHSSTPVTIDPVTSAANCLQCVPPAAPNSPSESAVPALVSLAGWAIFAVIFYGLDRPARRRWKALTA